MDSQTATTILTDIIAQTNKFQHPKVSPQALKTASVLVEKGADYQRASQKQSNQKPLSSLCLWGEVLKNLVCDNETGMCWSVLVESCFIKTETTPTQLPQLLLRLRDYIYPKEIIIIFWSDPLKTRSHSPFGNRALITSSQTDFNTYLKPLPIVQKNNFIAIPLQDKELGKASNHLIRYLQLALLKNS